MKNFTTLYCDILNLLLPSKGSWNIGLQETLICLAVHILYMAILGGWWQDQLPSRRLNKLTAATQCTF
jgi:hypothetical protein